MSESSTILGGPPYNTPGHFEGGHLRRIGGAFLAGYNTALEDSNVNRLARELDAQEPAFRGFAYEGAAMGLALLDFLMPWPSSRWQAFCRGPASDHIYLAYVGAGWVLARVPMSVDRRLARLDPLIRWLVLDGYGFHEGFFHGQRYLANPIVPRRVRGFGGRAFDQGFGRCLWFLECASVDGITRRIASFPLERRADLWSGVGLAAVYAGEATEQALLQLKETAGAFRPQLQQGAAFAAKARIRGRCATSYTERACVSLCEMSASKAAALTDAALANLSADGAEPAYEAWRCRVQTCFAPQGKLNR